VVGSAPTYPQGVIDPIADNIFDAVGTDVTAKGVVETSPKTDEDWAKVRQGAVTLAEGGGQVGILLGLLFVVAGCGRLYLARRS